MAIASPCVLETSNGTDVSVRENGLFHTGDRGYLSNGHLFVTGRKKDLIIIAGRNIHPEDLEATVNGTIGIIPGRAVAFGVPDDNLGTERAVVVAEIDGRGGTGPVRHSGRRPRPAWRPLTTWRSPTCVSCPRGHSASRPPAS